MKKRSNLRSVLFYIIVIIAMISISSYLLQGMTKQKELVYSDIMDMFENREVEEFVVSNDSRITITKTSGEEVTYTLYSISMFKEDVQKYIDAQHNPNAEAEEEEKPQTDAVIEGATTENPDAATSDETTDEDKYPLKKYHFEAQKDIPWWVTFLPYIIIIAAVIIMYVVMMNQAMGKGGKISYGDVNVTYPEAENTYHITSAASYHSESSVWAKLDLTQYAGKEVVITMKGKGTAPAGTKDALVFCNAWSTKDAATVKVAGTDLNVFESMDWSAEFTVTLTVPEEGILWFVAGNWGASDPYDAYVQIVSVVDPNAPVVTDIFAGTWTDGSHTVTIADGKATFAGFADEDLDGVSYSYSVDGNTATTAYTGFNWGSIKLTVDGTSMAFVGDSGSYTLTKQA